MTPIDRACFTIIEALRAHGDLCDDCGEPEYAQVEGSFEVEPVARAVLKAIREPSAQMVEAGALGANCGADEIPAIWQDMIDVALDER